MIVSFEHNYIFFKVPKTAGTSVEMALSRFCGPRDIITPIHPRDEVRRRPPMRAPQNYSDDPEMERQFAEAVARRDKPVVWLLFRELRTKARFRNHSRAVDIRNHLDPAFWRRAFKFTIDRNPFERVISSAFWRLTERNARSVPTAAEIADSVDWVLERASASLHRYTIDGAVVVDRILRYEDLTNELSSIADKVGGDISDLLPHAKRSPRKPEQTAANLLTESQKRRIVEKHQRVFDLLGYPRGL